MNNDNDETHVYASECGACTNTRQRPRHIRRHIIMRQVRIHPKNLNKCVSHMCMLDIQAKYLDESMCIERKRITQLQQPELFFLEAASNPEAIVCPLMTRKQMP